MSATSSSAKKAAGAESVNDIFHEAMQNYEKTLKAGIDLQEESVNLWKTLLSKLGSPEEFQAKLEAMQADVFPLARKRMEEFLEMFSKSSHQTMELFEKSMSIYQATSVTDAQRRLQDLMESSLAALRVNVQTVLNTNTKIMTSWKDMADKFGPATK